MTGRFRLGLLLGVLATAAQAQLPADPLAASGSQWHLKKFPVWPNATAPNDVGLDLEGAWAITRGTAYVGIPDNGIQLGHPDLDRPSINWDGKFYPFRVQFAANVIGGSSVDERQDGVIPVGHGTHVAGIIGARTSDASDGAAALNPPSEGAAGICWRCSLIVAKVGNGGQPEMTAVVSGIRHALGAGAQVINLSFGASPGGRIRSTDRCQTEGLDADYQSFCDLLDRAEEMDVIIVAAAGNRNRSTRTHLSGDLATRWPIDFPASDPRSIAVGGLDVNGARWNVRSEQDTIQGLGSNSGEDLADHGLIAPAVDVASTFYSGGRWNGVLECGDEFGETLGWGYGLCTGTSMAAPIVTGIVALMRSIDPMSTKDVIREVLFSEASDASCGAPREPNVPTFPSNGNGPPGITNPDDERCRSNTRGYGVPSARRAVTHMRDAERVLPRFCGHFH
jgi:serine protease